MRRWLATLAFAPLAACFVMPAQRSNYPAQGDPYASGRTSATVDPGLAPGAMPPTPEGPPNSPAVVSVTLRSSCGSTVRVFYGDKPPYSSGTSGTLSAHSVESHQFRAGDMIWLVDDHDQPVASTGVGPGTREIEVAESCTSLIAH